MKQNKQFPTGLTENEALFRSMIEGLAEGVIIADFEEVALYCNDRICEMTGYTREEIISKRCYDLVATPEQGQEMLRLNEQRKQGLGDRFEMLLHKKDGTPIWMEIHVNPYRNASGEVIGTLSACSDITRRKQAEAALHKLNEELESRVQERTVQLEAQNRLLLARDRILEATASAANALLTLENFEQAVNIALQIIGKSLDTDRVLVIENFAPSSDLAAVEWKVLYEWNSLHAVSQISDPELSQGNYEGIEEWYEVLSRCQGISRLLEEMPEPFRSVQVKLGLKALHVVPIFVEGKFWGTVGFDDCREAKRRSPAELAVLRIAADCIGSSIQRDRTQKAIFQAEQERSQELERHNAELQQMLNRLSESEQRYRQLMELASEGIFRVEYEEPIPVDLPVEEQVKQIYQQFRYAEHNLAFAKMYGYDQADALVGTSLAHVMDAPENTVQMKQFVRDGHQMRNQETVEVDRYGRKRYFFNNGFSIIKDGYALGGWGTQIDITELREVQQVLMQAEQARSAELAKANEALKRSLDILATDPDLNRFIGHVLKVAAECLGSSLTEYWWHEPEPSNVVHIGLTYLLGQILTPEEQPGHPGLGGLTIKPVTIHYENLHHRQRYFVREDILTDPFQEDYAAESGVDVRGWYLARGIRKELNIPLNIGETSIGGLCVYLPVDHHLTEQQIELGYALAQQVTLAIQLTRLAEAAKQAAIAREQEKAALSRADELAKANLALQRSVEKMSQDSSLETLLSHVLVEAANLSSACGGGLFVQQSSKAGFRPVAVIENGILRSGEDWLSQGGIERFVERSVTDETGFFKQLTQGKINYLRVDEPDELWWADSIAYHQRFGYRVVMHIPMMLHGEVLGLFALCFKQVIEPKPEIVEYLTTLANQATLALELTRLAEEAKLAAIAREQEKAATERAAELAKVNEVLRRTASQLVGQYDLNRFLESVLLEVAQEIGAVNNCIFLYDHPSHTLLMHNFIQDGQVINIETDPRFEIWRTPVPADINPAWALVESHGYVWHELEDDHVDGDVWDFSEAWHRMMQHRFVMSVLLQVGGQPLGLMGIGFRESVHLSSERIELVQALAHQAVLAVQLTRLAEEAKQAAISKEREQAATERAKEQLKDSQRRLALLIQQLPVAIVEWNTKFEIKEWNPAAERIFGYSREEVLGLPFSFLVPDSAQAHVSQIVGQLLNQQGGGWSINENRTKDNKTITCEWYNTPLITVNKELIGVASMALDITARKQAEKALQQAAVLEERNRIACEIHDTLAQVFGGILMQLQAASYFSTTKPDNVQQHLVAARELAHSGLAEARRSVWSLYQQGTQYQNLANTVPQALKQLTAGTSVQANVSIQGTPYSVAADVGMNLLRIVQESVNNTLRHAQAQTIQIALIYAPAQVRLSVSDDGCGFEPQLPSQGFGLVSMRQRAEQIGAVLQIISSVGTGTEIQVVMPICSYLQNHDAHD